jgi:hypothetical protein
MNKARTIIFRMLATFAVSALGVVGAGAIAGVDGGTYGRYWWGCYRCRGFEPRIPVGWKTYFPGN